MSLFFSLLAVITAIALCIVAFLLISAGDIKKFRALYETKPKKATLPLITKYGDVISSPQDLDITLMTLKNKLKEKYQEMENFKTKMQNRLQSLEKLENFKKGCFEMQADLVRIDEECNELQRKIDYFKKLQIRLQDEYCPNIGYMGDSDWIVGQNAQVL